jgi:hypothetical protein
MKFTLHRNGNVDDLTCYWWTIQVADGPCQGYYLDLNPASPTMLTSPGAMSPPSAFGLPKRVPGAPAPPAGPCTAGAVEPPSKFVISVPNFFILAVASSTVPAGPNTVLTPVLNVSKVFLSLNNILNAILSMFIVSQPLTMEPLWCTTDTIQLENYNKIITHANINISLCDFLNNTQHPFYLLFHSICIPYFLEHYESINQSIQMIKSEDIYIPLYKLQYKIDNYYLITQLRTTFFNLHTTDNPIIMTF